MSVLTELEFPPHLVCLKDVEALLQCPICFDYLNIAMMTKCSHNFCSLCIRKFLSHKLHCPVCNLAMTELDLRNNRILDDLVMSFQAARQQLSRTNLDAPSVSPKTPRPNAKRKAPNTSRPSVESPIMKSFLQKGNSPSSSSYSSPQTKKSRLQHPCNTKDVRQNPLQLIRAVKVELVPLPVQMTLEREGVTEIPEGTNVLKEVQAKASGQMNRTVKEERVEVAELGTRTVKQETAEEPALGSSSVLTSTSDSLKITMQERVAVPKRRTRSVKQERVEAPEQGTWPVKEETMEGPALKSSSGFTSSPESPSTSQCRSMKAVVKVECPACSVGIPESQINRHLDTCLIRAEKKESLRSSAKKRKPLSKLVYSLLTIQDLRRRLRALHLPVQGSRDQLVRRHQEYVLMYNAECDSFNPKSAEDIAKEVVANEMMRAQQQSKSKSVMVFSKNQTEAEIDQLHSNYRKQHSAEFSRLIDQVKGRREASKKACIKKEVPEGGGEAEKGSPTDELSGAAARVLRVSSEDPAQQKLRTPEATEPALSPALSDVSVSSSIADVFGTEADGKTTM